MSLMEKLERDGLQRQCKREVEELHQLFVAWFQGSKPKHVLLQELEQRLQPGFSHVAPNGQCLMGRNLLLGHLQDKYACYKDRVFQIDIFNVQLLWSDPSSNRCLCTYEEWQSWKQEDEDPNNGDGSESVDDDDDASKNNLLQFGRLSTCLLERTSGDDDDHNDDDNNENSDNNSSSRWTWAHVHETWLESDRPPQPSSQYAARGTETNGNLIVPQSISSRGDEDTVMTGPMPMMQQQQRSTVPVTPSVSKAAAPTTTSRSPLGASLARRFNNMNKSINRRLAVLMSPQTLSREQVQHQNESFALLQDSKLEYDLVDGTDFHQRHLREHLFDVSNVRGKYPQFFVAVDYLEEEDEDEAQENTTGKDDDDEEETTPTRTTYEYWGDYSRLIAAQAAGTLASDLALGKARTGGAGSAAAAAAVVENGGAGFAAALGPPPQPQKEEDTDEEEAAASHKARNNAATPVVVFSRGAAMAPPPEPPLPPPPPPQQQQQEQHPENVQYSRAIGKQEAGLAASALAAKAIIDGVGAPPPPPETQPQEPAEEGERDAIDPILGASVTSSSMDPMDKSHTEIDDEDDKRESSNDVGHAPDDNKEAEDESSSSSSGSSSSGSSSSSSSTKSGVDNIDNELGNVNAKEQLAQQQANGDAGDALLQMEPEEEDIEAPAVAAKALPVARDELEQAFLHASQGILEFEEDTTAQGEDNNGHDEKEAQGESDKSLKFDVPSPIPQDVSPKRHVSAKLTKYAKPLLWENALVGLHICGFDVGSSQGPMGDEAWFTDTGMALEELAQSRSIPRPRRKICLPEMVFPTAHVALEGHGFWISFDAVDALEEWARSHHEIALHSRIPHNGVSVIQSKDAQLWESRRKHGKELADVSSTFHYDWTFSTPFCGKVEGGTWQELDASGMRMSLLTNQSVPIIFFDEVVLFEDDMHDNGEVKFVVKIRVMPSCAYVLSRLYCRVDEVVVRCREMRLLVDFFGMNPQVFRDVSWRECKWEELAANGLPTDVRSWRCDVETAAFNELLKQLPEVSLPKSIPKHAVLVRDTVGQSLEAEFDAEASPEEG